MISMASVCGLLTREMLFWLCVCRRPPADGGVYSGCRAGGSAGGQESIRGICWKPNILCVIL